jgi:hypothetical protein
MTKLATYGCAAQKVVKQLYRLDTMRTYIMTTEELKVTIANGRWFAGFRYRWKKLGSDYFQVMTNYVPADVAAQHTRTLEKGVQICRTRMKRGCRQ